MLSSLGEHSLGHMVRNPAWSRDELILACDLVMQNGWRELRENDPRVRDLSGILQRLPIHPESLRSENFRSPNSVSRKTTDIATRHPGYIGKATRGGALDLEVLNDFLANPDEMHERAERLRRAAEAGDYSVFTAGELGFFDDDDDDAVLAQESVSAVESASVTRTWGILTVPAIASESTTGPDQLGMARDALALATLIASKRLTPPLAVAVYGEWGSGKTFFMQQVENQVDRLSRNDRGSSTFDRSIRHIKFGAWHYSRGNLWASLLEHIFCSLCPPDSSADQLLEEATAGIDAIEATITEADEKVTILEKRLKEADKEIAEVRSKYERRLKSLESVQVSDIAAVIKADEDVKEGLDAARSELRLPAAGTEARELAAAAGEVVSLASRTVVLATSGKSVWRSPLAGAVYAGLAGLVVMYILGTATPTALRGVGALSGTLLAVGATGATWLRMLSGLGRRLLEPAERMQRQIAERLEKARENHEADIAKREAEVRETQRKLDLVRERRAKAAEELILARKQRESLTPAKLLQQYLAERVASSDYNQHLGVVGTVHRDLMRLSDHLRASASEPDVPVKRIVLYIDDLDRCPPATVVAVLEAVHLLLALPLFVVVVGIDRRILDRSLRILHPELIEPGSTTRSDSNASSSLDAPTTANYLEKIFQLSYTLPPMTPDGCKALLHAAMASNRGPAGTGESPESEASEESTDGSETGFAATDTEDDAYPTTEQLAEALTISTQELATLDLVAPLVATTPRRAKRFGNVYTVVRARLSDEQEVDTAALAVAAAILLGAPKTLGAKLREFAPTSDFEIPLKDWATAVLAESTDAAETARVEAFLENIDGLGDLAMRAVVDILPPVLLYV